MLGTVGIGPIDMEKFAARLIDTFIGMGAEIVALALEKIGGKASASVAVKVSQGGTEGWCWNTALYAERNDVAPMLLAVVQRVSEIGIEHQISQCRILCIGIGDLLQEPRANDAAASPDLSNGGEVKRPVVSLLCLGHELKSLGIGADLRTIERVPNGFHECAFVGYGCGFRA